MKNFPASFAEHIASGATTLCNCWLIERIDGTKLGFTDHDRALEFDGRSFAPAHGLDGGEVTAKLGVQVDTSEIAGILHSSAISEDDILLGRYDGAAVTTFRVNWRDVSVRANLRVDSIGEIVREDGYFRAELRSQQQALNISKGRRYQSICDVVVGDARCRVDLQDTAYKSNATVALVVDRYTLQLVGLNSFETGWFSFGKAVWTTGNRMGITDTIVSHTNSEGVVSVSFEKPVGDWATLGDQLGISAGCDRRFSTCLSKFQNVDNFQGFPHIPGSDFMLSYPKSGDALTGSALVR